MTRHLLDEVLDARTPRPVSQPQPPAVSSVRLIPRMCSCTWMLRLGAIEATWTLTGTDPGCKLHGGGSDETGASE